MQDMERIERVKKMEKYYDALRAYLDSGLWLSDFEADERGQLPGNLKRGVLSEDGLYDLLCDIDEQKRLNSFIKTENLSFSHWKSEDVELARSLWGDKAVTRYICRSGVFTEADIAARLEREIENEEKFSVQYWPVFEKCSGELVGCCGLRPYAEGVYELGFHLREKFWHLSYGYEAAKAVIDYAFNTLGAKALFAGHHPENAASRRLLLRLGFEYKADEFYAPTGLYHPGYEMKKSTVG